MWQQEFFNLKQRTNTVDTYIAQFKKLQRKVDPNGNFSADFIVQLFIKAKHWKIGKAMANSEKDDVNDITKQLAQLYINS
ncbi:230_t:CDS:2, partial [Cetraspora pellucida]